MRRRAEFVETGHARAGARGPSSRLARAVGVAGVLACATAFADNAVSLEFGHQRILTRKALKQSISSDASIVEAHVLRDDQVLVTANGIGKATVTLSFKKAVPETLSIVVTGRRLADLAPDERVEMVKGEDDCLKKPDCTDVRFQLDGETGFESSVPEVAKVLVFGRELRFSFGAPGQSMVRWTSRSGTHSLLVVVHPKP